MPTDRRTISVPAFARWDDYVGEWCYEPTRFASLWAAVRAADLPAHMAAGPPPKPQPLTELVPAKAGKNIAVLKANGTLMKGQSSFGGTSTIQLRRELRAAKDDPAVAGILLHIDSPGGTVAGTDAVARDVRNARKNKPVWAFIDDMTASAAYWIASQAGLIVAGAPTALVGSIGTVLTIYDESVAAERAGVKTLVFATGPVKGAGTSGAVVTEEHQTYFQSVVNGIQTHFDQAVRSGRQMNSTQLAAVRSGGLWPASEAIDLRLVDQIRSLDQTIEALAASK